MGTDELDAPEPVRRAYSRLLATEAFTSTHIDFAGVPSCDVVAFQALLNSPVADRAFKNLLESATLEGQLYALSGLYFTDPESFRMHVARYREMNDSLTTQYGCVIQKESVATVVADVASGLWPREFKNAFK